MNLAGPSSGTVGIRVKTSSSTTGTVKIDDAYVGPARGVGSVAQARLVGEVSYAATASCVWSRSSASFGDFTSDTDCPAPTVAVNGGVGTIDTTDANLPQFTINNLPPGIVELSCEGSSGTGGGGAGYVGLQISDGTSARGTTEWYLDNSNQYPWHLTASFNYTTAGNRTFKFQGKHSGGTAFNVSNGASIPGPRCVIKHFPSVSEQVVRSDQNNGMPWRSGTCTGTWSTNTTYACQWRRVLDSIEVQAKVSLSGGPTGNFSVNLPTECSSCTIDTSKLADTSLQTLGFIRGDRGATAYTGVVFYSSTTSVAAITSGASSRWNATTPGTWAASDTISLYFKAPITQWRDRKSVV
jgi:hypothetical protein